MLRVTLCSRDMKEWVYLDVATLGEAVVRFPNFVVWYCYPVGA